MKKYSLIVNFLIPLILFVFLIKLILPVANAATTNSLEDQYKTTLIKLVRDILDIFSAKPQGGQLPQNPGTTPGVNVTLPSAIGTPIPYHPPAGYVYYAQCGGSYDNTLLPNGCTLCRAGCGPTTAAMILASLVNRSFTPPTVVNYYASHNYYLGCDGSRYTDAKSALTGLAASYGGLRTTDYLVYNAQPIDQVARDMKGYISSGWTLFALANYCENGCGHFFWIVDIDANNNVWAYDPYYGRYQAPPLNENKYYPFPKYRVAFGVRR